MGRQYTKKEKAEYKEQKRAEINALRQAVHDLASEIAEPNGDEAFDRYLAWVSRFHQYSAYNIALILSQRPEARQVAGYRRWQELGR